MSRERTVAALQKAAPPARWVLVLTGLAGLAGALLVGTGEFLLQFSPAGGYGDAAYTWMAQIPFARMQAGHFLAVLSAPLYLAGYWHLGKMLTRTNPWPGRFVMALGGYGFMVGAVWIGQRAMLGATVQAIAAGRADPALLHTLAALNEPLVNVLRVVIVLISLIWVVQIARGQTLYPRLMALISPALLLAAIFALYAWRPAYGAYVLPTAMNTTHAALFALSTLMALRVRTAAGTG